MKGKKKTGNPERLLIILHAAFHLDMRFYGSVIDIDPGVKADSVIWKYWDIPRTENGPKHPARNSSAGKKGVVNEEGQRRWYRLVKADKKVEQITALQQWHAHWIWNKSMNMMSWWSMLELHPVLYVVPRGPNVIRKLVRLVGCIKKCPYCRYTKAFRTQSWFSGFWLPLEICPKDLFQNSAGSFRYFLVSSKMAILFLQLTRCLH